MKHVIGRVLEKCKLELTVLERDTTSLEKQLIQHSLVLNTEML